MAVSYDDLTARARIREAALAQFSEHGYERTTIRGIAAAAGVSPGLLRHHFGSKQDLRDAVDQHVGEEIRRISDEIMVAGQRGSFAAAAVSREAIRPFHRYFMHALTDGSSTLAKLFDSIVGPTEDFLAVADDARDDEPYADRRARAAVLAAMALGVPLLSEQISRVLGVDVASTEGDRRVALALLDIYSHPMTTPALAATARDALEASLIPS